MSYTRQERLDIGKQIYNNEISKTDAAIKYSISEGTARDYMRLYRDVNGLPPKNRIQKEESTVQISVHSSEPDLSEYESIVLLSKLSVVSCSIELFSSNPIVSSLC